MIITPLQHRDIVYSLVEDYVKSGLAHNVLDLSGYNISELPANMPELFHGSIDITNTNIHDFSKLPSHISGSLYFGQTTYHNHYYKNLLEPTAITVTNKLQSCSRIQLFCNVDIVKFISVPNVYDRIDIRGRPGIYDFSELQEDLCLDKFDLTDTLVDQAYSKHKYKIQALRGSDDEAGLGQLLGVL